MTVTSITIRLDLNGDSSTASIAGSGQQEAPSPTGSFQGTNVAFGSQDTLPTPTSALGLASVSVENVPAPTDGNANLAATNLQPPSPSLDFMNKAMEGDQAPHPEGDAGEGETTTNGRKGSTKR